VELYVFTGNGRRPQPVNESLCFFGIQTNVPTSVSRLFQGWHQGFQSVSKRSAVFRFDLAIAIRVIKKMESGSSSGHGKPPPKPSL
jgi:hypothetical protein